MTARSELGERVAFALDALGESDRAIVSRFRAPGLVVEAKGDGSPVTLADREAETILRRRIGGAFSEDGILGEEGGETPGRSGIRWILDPIDGTKSFVRGVPLFATLIGIERNGEAVAGILHLPALAETIHAVRGEGAWWRVGGEVRPARVSRCDRLEDALYLVTSPEGFTRRGRGDAFEALFRKARSTRTWGDAYGYALVATGRADIMMDPALAIWDAAPLLPVLEEAGGTFTDWTGLATIHGGDGIATNRILLKQVLECLGPGSEHGRIPRSKPGGKPGR